MHDPAQARAQPAPKSLYLATEWPRLDQGGVEMIGVWVEEHPDTRLIIIDTFAKVRPPQRSGGSVYEQDYAAGEGLKRLSDTHSIGIMPVHHSASKTLTIF